MWIRVVSRWLYIPAWDCRCSATEIRIIKEMSVSLCLSIFLIYRTFKVFFSQDPQFAPYDVTYQINLILVAKHGCLKITNNKVIVKWNCHNYYTQTILLAQFTVKLLQQTNSAADLIEKYIDFLLQYSDNVTYFNTKLSPHIS